MPIVNSASQEFARGSLASSLMVIFVSNCTGAILSGAFTDLFVPSAFIPNQKVSGSLPKIVVALDHCDLVLSLRLLLPGPSLGGVQIGASAPGPRFGGPRGARPALCLATCHSAPPPPCCCHIWVPHRLICPGTRTLPGSSLPPPAQSQSEIVSRAVGESPGSFEL